MPDGLIRRVWKDTVRRQWLGHCRLFGAVCGKVGCARHFPSSGMALSPITKRRVCSLLAGTRNRVIPGVEAGF